MHKEIIWSIRAEQSAIMWITESSRRSVMRDKTGQRKLCLMGQLRSYLTRSVRWRERAQSDRWLQSYRMWESAAQPATREQVPSLYKGDKHPCCAPTFYRESWVKQGNSWLKFMPFVCFMEVAFTSRNAFYQSVELSAALCALWMQEKSKENVCLCRVNGEEVHLCSLFWQFC